MEKQQNIHNIWVRESRESENFSWEKSRVFFGERANDGMQTRNRESG